MSLERGKLCKGSTSHTDTAAVVPQMLLQGLSWPDSGCHPCSPAPWPQLLILHAPIHPPRCVANCLETHRGSLSPQKEDLSLAPTLASGHNVPAWPGLDTPRVDTHPICRAVRTLRPPAERGQELHCVKVLSLSWGHLLHVPCPLLHPSVRPAPAHRC